MVMDVLACTFCCLGSSSKSLLVKHKTICIEDAAEKLSIEDSEHCKAYSVDYCIGCGLLVNILNKNSLNSADNTTEIRDCFGQTGISALRIIPAVVKFDLFTGLTTECPWEMNEEKFVLDENKLKYWMQYINPTRNTFDQNLHVFQSEGNKYYQSTRKI